MGRWLWEDDRKFLPIRLQLRCELCVIMKAHLCRAANPKGVLMSHSCAAPTIVTHSDDATFNPAAELTTTKLHESILELRTLAAAIETQYTSKADQALKTSCMYVCMYECMSCIDNRTSEI
jgi:hypothetical protein